MEIVTNEQEFTETEVISSEPTKPAITLGEQQIGIRFTDDDKVFGADILKAHANLVNGLWQTWGLELERLAAIKGNPDKLPMNPIDLVRNDFSMAVTHIVNSSRAFRAAINYKG